MADKTKSTEAMQAELLEIQLETARIGMAEAKARNAKFLQAEEARHKGNRQRQTELKRGAANRRAAQKNCRHKAGGSPDSIHRGGGKFAFSLLTRAGMPDGKTELIQCQRCALHLYGRERTPAEVEKLKALDAADASKDIKSTRYEDHLLWLELRDISIEDGIPNNFMRGPTFSFQDAEGVNFIPEMV